MLELANFVSARLLFFFFFKQKLMLLFHCLSVFHESAIYKIRKIISKPQIISQDADGPLPVSTAK